MRRRPETATLVTTAARGHQDDIDLRQRRYLRTQLLRVLCLGGGVWLPVPLALRLVCFAGALALPWCGVVMANAGPVARGRRGKEAALSFSPRREDEAPAPARAPSAGAPRVIEADR